MMSRFALVALVFLGACGGMRINPPQKPPDDQTVATRVRTSLLNAPNVHANEVNVDVAAGVVTLTGTVHDQNEVNAAVGAARKVEGVRDVRNELHTKGDPPASSASTSRLRSAAAV
jgi:BON domain-containing protein